MKECLLGLRLRFVDSVMYEFLDRLINLALPKVRDFQGVPSKFDGRGNYNLGIKEWIIFPEVDYDVGGKILWPQYNDPYHGTYR